MAVRSTCVSLLKDFVISYVKVRKYKRKCTICVCSKVCVSSSILSMHSSSSWGCSNNAVVTLSEKLAKSIDAERLQRWSTDEPFVLLFVGISLSKFKDQVHNELVPCLLLHYNQQSSEPVLIWASFWLVTS